MATKHQQSQDRSAPETTSHRSGDGHSAARSVKLLLDSSSEGESQRSIDSDKTEDPRYPWDSKSAAIKTAGRGIHKRPAPLKPKPASPPTDAKTTLEIEESPTTKTLNSLSQNMDDLHREPSGFEKHSSSNREATAHAFAKNPESQRPLYPTTSVPPANACNLPQGYHLDWEIHPIIFVPSSSAQTTQQQTLGIVIVRDAIPIAANGEQPSQRKIHCVVKRVHADGIAFRSGLQPGDWFLSPSDATKVLQEWPNNNRSSGSTRESAAAAAAALVRKYCKRDGPLKPATFDEIQAWSRESFPEFRPVLVLRKRKPTNHEPTHQASVRTAASNKTTTKISHATAPPSMARDDPASIDIDNDIDNDNDHASVPPFCVLCNYHNPRFWEENRIRGTKRTKPKRPPRNHHTWCSKHKTFDAQRVKKLMARMNHCHRVLGCRACFEEFQTGKVISVKKTKPTGAEEILHNEACRLYQQGLKNEERRKRKQEEEEERKERECEAASKNQAREDAKKRKHATAAPRKGARNGAGKRRATSRGGGGDGAISTDNSSDDYGGYEDGSIYQPPTRKTRMETFLYNPKQRTSIDSKEAVAGRKRNSKTRRSHERVNEELHRSTTPRRKTSGERNKNDPAKSGTKHGGRHQTIHEEDSERAKPVWVPLDDNPWGEEGYQTGDVLLFGPQLGVGHHETHLLSNQRYKVNPFGNDSTYRTTHCTPEEGLALIVLKRDSMGRMPWGFQPIRDEFGHACLVESVNPNSPASAATFLGVPAASGSNDVSASTRFTAASCGLDVNDMIVAINGTPVGGMTEAGLELELELAAPNLILAVSRYKHAEEVARKYAETEQKMLDCMDNAARDDRLMGWREIGCGYGIEPRPKNAAATFVANAASPLTQPLVDTAALKSSTTGRSKRYGDDQGLPSDKEIATVQKIDMSARKGGNSFDKRSKQYVASGERRTTILPKKSHTHGMEADANSLSETSEDSAAHDENPQMGCVCGVKHPPSRLNTFWIQCESCNSWYHVAKECIGFDDEQANLPDFVWNCLACVPETESDEEVVPSNSESANLRVATPNEQHCSSTSLSNGLNEDIAKCGNGENVPNSSSPKVYQKNNDQGGRQSLALRRNPSNGIDVGSLTQSKVNSSQLLTSTTKQSVAARISNDVTKSAQTILETTPPHTPYKSSEPELHPHVSSVNKPKLESPSTPLALRQLKDHNKEGLSYWGKFDSERLSNNPDRVSRKRKSPTNKCEQQRFDGTGGRDQGLVENNESLIRSTLLSNCARSRLTRKRVKSETKCDDHSTEGSEKSESKSTVPTRSFEVGDLVYVESHSWPNVNNSGGIGKIQRAYISTEGDRVYDVKYPALLRTEKVIMEEFISSYCFD